MHRVLSSAPFLYFKVNGQPVEAVEYKQSSLLAVVQRSHQREELCRLGQRWGLRLLRYDLAYLNFIVGNLMPTLGYFFTDENENILKNLPGSENNSLYIYYKGLSKQLYTFKFDTVRSALVSSLLSSP